MNVHDSLIPHLYGSGILAADDQLPLQLDPDGGKAHVAGCSRREEGSTLISLRVVEALEAGYDWCSCVNKRDNFVAASIDKSDLDELEMARYAGRHGSPPELLARLRDFLGDPPGTAYVKHPGIRQYLTDVIAEHTATVARIQDTPEYRLAVAPLIVDAYRALTPQPSWDLFHRVLARADLKFAVAQWLDGSHTAQVAELLWQAACADQVWVLLTTNPGRHRVLRTAVDWSTTNIKLVRAPAVTLLSLGGFARLTDEPLERRHMESAYEVTTNMAEIVGVARGLAAAER